jgi:hypothetical protein
MKILNRTLVIINSVAWSIVIWFPFARFFSILNMHWLSKTFALVFTLSPLAFLIIAIVLLIRLRANAQHLKFDLALALFSLFADLVLLGGFGEGLL